MKKTLFVFSDPHGDYRALTGGLKKAGYDKSNLSHQLLGLGDYFGRADKTGEGSRQIYEYLISSEHASKPIAIHGNHESILYNVLRDEKLSYSDIQNGEAKTIGSFVGMGEYDAILFASQFCSRIKKETNLFLWLKSLPYYFETEDYLFVHGWVPTTPTGKIGAYSRASKKEWENAGWADTISSIFLFQNNYPYGYKKTIVFGHWGTWDLHRTMSYDFSKIKSKENHEIYRNPRWKLIGLDATTVLSHKVNVLVIEDQEIT